MHCSSVCSSLSLFFHAGIRDLFPGDVTRVGAPFFWRNLGGIHRLSLLPLHSLQLRYVLICGGQKVVVSLNL